MAQMYNPGFPAGYNPYQPYPQYYQPQMAQPQTAQQAFPVQQQAAPPVQPQIQNGGFISVASIEVARNWPIAPGNSVTFRDENAPYVYTKTMGFSQLDRPIFEKYRLVKEEETPQTAQNAPTIAYSTQGSIDDTAYALKSDVEAVRSEIEALRADIDNAAKKKAVVKVKKEDKEDEE